MSLFTAYIDPANPDIPILEPTVISTGAGSCCDLAVVDLDLEGYVASYIIGFAQPFRMKVHTVRYKGGSGTVHRTLSNVGDSAQENTEDCFGAGFVYEVMPCMAPVGLRV